MCSFTVAEHETLVPADRSAMPLCSAVETDRIKDLAVNEGAGKTLAYAGERRYDTGIDGVLSVDFTNSGASETLVQLGYASGGGRGWASTYYDIAHDGKVLSSGKLHELLMVLQYVAGQGNFYEPGIADDNVTRLFTYEGRAYFDIAASGGDAYDDTPVHEIRSLRGDRIETECAASFRATWKLSSIEKEYRK